jgi:polysaccharide pyruvyl transferase WcaK-like protein
LASTAISQALPFSEKGTGNFQMKEVALIAATFYGNRGAEAMLSTSIGLLRERVGKTTIFNVFSYYPKQDRELVADDHIVIHSSTPAYLVLNLLPSAILYRLFGMLRLRSIQKFLPEATQALARSQVLICLAGVSFIDGRLKFLPFNIATVLPALLLGVPVVKFAQALGPFRDKLSRLVARIILPRCKHIFARGAKTHQYLEELFPVAGFYDRADDVAFSFREEFSLSIGDPNRMEKSLPELHRARGEGRTIIGVCPSVVVAKRAEAAGWDYTKFMVKLISGLVGDGYSIALFPNATRAEDMDKPHNNDLPLLRRIAAGIDTAQLMHVTTFSGSLNAAQIHQIIKECDVAAVSRFHAMVGALVCHTPIVVIGWSHKYMEVMERFGQQDMVLDYRDGQVGPVLKRIEQLIFQCEERVARIASALPEVQASSRQQTDYVSTIIGVEE